jgi:hypothetical protein
MEARTSSQPPQWKVKQLVPRSPCKQGATTIVLSCIPEGVNIAGNMLGHVEKLRYSNNDMMDTKHFPEFSNKVYLQIVGIGTFDESINQPVQWASGLAKNKILGLLEFPHFGRGQYANNYIKKLMEVTHGGSLWLEQIISIDIELIAYTTGLPSWREDPTQFLEDKTKEKSLAEEMKKKYGTERGSPRIIIKRISDAVTRMTIEVMG